LDATFCIKPVACPAVVEIAELTLRNPATKEIVWRAATKQALDALKIVGTACALPCEAHLRFLSFGNDPQLVLPFAAHTLPDQPLRVEISLRADGTESRIADGLATLRSRPRSAAHYITPCLGLTGDDVLPNGLRSPVLVGAEQIVRFENIESLCSAPTCRLRLHPQYHPAFLRISRIVLFRGGHEAILFAAPFTEGFDRFDVSEGAVKEVVDGNLLLVTHEGEYLQFPQLEMSRETRCRLEIQMESLRVPPLLAPLAGNTLSLPPKDAVRRTVFQNRIPPLEGLSLNAIEFQNFDAALAHALTHPRKKAAASDHQALIHAVSRSLPDTLRQSKS